MSGPGADARRARVREHVELFNEDWERWVESIPDGAVLATDPNWPDGGVFETKEEAHAFLATFIDAWSSVELVVGELSALPGDGLISPSRWEVKGTTSGIETTIEFCIVWFFDGTTDLTEARFFFDESRAREFAASRP